MNIGIDPQVSPALPLQPATQEPTVAKRPRGRPRKNPQVALPEPTPEIQASAAAASPVVKRGRGRPRKTPQSPAATNGTNGKVSNGADSQKKVRKCDV